MRGYYGYRRKNRLPVFVICIVILLGLGFTGRWGWVAYRSNREVPVEVEIKTIDDGSGRIALLIASNDIAIEQYWVRISKKDHILELYKGAEMEKKYSIAVGAGMGNKERPGDNRTPEGSFTVEQTENSIHWVYDFGDGKGPIEGAYGPFFIRLQTGWDGIGIHGTHDPSSIGTNVTAGCIRMLNDELTELVDSISNGTLVIIEE